MKGYIYITGTGTDPALRGNLNDPLFTKDSDPRRLHAQHSALRHQGRLDISSSAGRSRASSSTSSVVFRLRKKSTP